MRDKVLSVCLITYNHAKFIREAIEGVLMQEVDFSWELIIADDFSTDGTREILIEYSQKHPSFITLILQEKNVGPAQNWIDLLNKPKGKYIAYLDGDDYWTEPNKLQKQVDFLNANTSYSACCHNVTQYDERNAEKHIFWTWQTEKDIDMLQLSTGNCISTLSLVFRNDKALIAELPTFIDYPIGDYVLNLLLAKKGMIKYFPFLGGVYRVHEKGSWSTKSNSIDHAVAIGTRSVFMFEGFLSYFSSESRKVKRNFTRQLLGNYNKLRIVFAMQGEKTASKRYAVLFLRKGCSMFLLNGRKVFSAILNLLYFSFFKKRAKY